MTEIQGDSNCQNCQKQSKVGQNYPKLSNIVKEIQIVCSTILCGHKIRTIWGPYKELLT